MLFRAVGNRVAVALDALGLQMSREDAIERLTSLGFEIVSVDLVAMARSLVGEASYRRGARLAEAPATFDCSSLTKWLYAQRGIWLPRRSIQQRVCGSPTMIHDLMPGDLVFATGFQDYWHEDPRDGVGHVGLATGEGTVLHAANRRLGVVESSLETFVVPLKFRGACRIVPSDRQVTTLICPPHREVEISDDIRWIVLQTLGRCVDKIKRAV